MSSSLSSGLRKSEAHARSERPALSGNGRCLPPAADVPGPAASVEFGGLNVSGFLTAETLPFIFSQASSHSKVLSSK